MYENESCVTKMTKAAHKGPVFTRKGYCRLSQLSHKPAVELD
jgi:hypothetical protein